MTPGHLSLPDSITLLHLPPYNPELNPVENIWQYLRQNQLSNRVFEGYDTIVDAGCNAWMALMNSPEQIRSMLLGNGHGARHHAVGMRPPTRRRVVTRR